MNPEDIAAAMDHIRQATASYPRFDDGRIDYTNEHVCFVLNCVVVCGDQVLLTKRGENVITYPGGISGVSGFIDDLDSDLEAIARNELSEEVALPLESIESMAISNMMIEVDEKLNREWHLFAVLVELSNIFTPQTNWENKSAQWFTIEEAWRLPLNVGFPEVLTTALSLRRRKS